MDYKLEGLKYNYFFKSLILNSVPLFLPLDSTRICPPFDHIEQSFFDLYHKVLYTQSERKQKYFLPLGNPCGLKEVSEFMGYLKFSK